MEYLLAYGPMTFIIIFMYFFLIRPQKKREAAVEDMRNKLEVGDQITTIGGVIGRIVAIRDDQITLETGADRIKLYFAKWAVQGKTEQPKD
ncbi:MAG: preprotein translocase subunit YajC [Clostridia bacterium]